MPATFSAAESLWGDTASVGVNIDTSLIRFPASFTFVLRAFTTLEGLGRALDPNYKFAAVAQPYALELLQLQVGMQSD